MTDGAEPAEPETERLHRDLDLERAARAASQREVNALRGRLTERERVSEKFRRSEALTRSMLYNMLHGLVEVDGRGAITAMNREAERIFRAMPGGLLGQDMSVLFPLRDVGANRAAFHESIRERIGQISELTGLRQDGELFPCELALVEFSPPDGGPHLAASLRDLSAQREGERMKKDFVANVSHELRTPLTSIRGSLTLLKSGALGDMPAEAQEMIEIAERNTVRLVSLINDILDIERAASGRIDLHFAEVPIGLVIDRSFESVQGMADASQVRLARGSVADARVTADGDRLVQVLVNLLSNAVKFSSPGSAVTVTCARTGEAVEVCVSDKGRGIPAAHMGSLFQRFQQVQSSDAREKGGSGLGLAICKAIVEQHGGTIGVTSTVGVGSTFHFRVPTSDHVPAAETAGGRVLVFVESEAADAYVTAALEAKRFDVVVTGGVDEAWICGEGADMATIIARVRAQPTAGLPLVVVGEGVLLRLERAAEQLAVVVGDAPGSGSGPLVEPPREPDGDGDVLLIEDDASLQAVLRQLLVARGIAVRTASTGQQALQLAQERAPRLVVLDVGLPDVDGFQVTELLRRDPTLRSLPLLVYTGRALDPEQRLRLRLGATHFLTKSRASEAQFVTLVCKLLAGRGASA